MKVEQGHINKSLILLFLFFLIPLASASIISINSGGSDVLVTTPNQPIEGFFFGREPTEIVHTGGGGGVSFAPEVDSGQICNFSKDFISEHTKNGNLTFSDDDLEDLRISMIEDLQITIEKDMLEDILLNVCEIKVIKEKVVSKLPLLLLIVLLIGGFTFLIYENKRKQFIVIWYKKIKNKIKRESTSS